MDRRVLKAFSLAQDVMVLAQEQPEPSKREELKALSLKHLESALFLLETVRTQRSLVTPFSVLKSGEYLVVAAEACLKCGRLQSARDVAEQYFRQERSDEVGLLGLLGLLCAPPSDLFQVYFKFI